MMNRKIAFFVGISILLMLDGCYSKTRKFVAEQEDFPVLSHWSLTAVTYSAEDYFNCYARLTIERKYWDEDSLKNMAARIDSLEFVVGDSVYKTVEWSDYKRKFQYPEKERDWKNGKFGTYFYNLLESGIYAYYPYPVIAKDIKEVYMNVYASFKSWKDGHIESKEVKVKLKEKNTVRVGSFLFD